MTLLYSVNRPFKAMTAVSGREPGRDVSLRYRALSNEANMRCCSTLRFLTVAFCAGGYLFSGKAQETKPQATTEQLVINQPGEYVSPSGVCTAQLKTSSLGGFLVLTVKTSSNKSTTVKDITGMAWAGIDKLVYTTSPVYGSPGVYIHSCNSNRLRRIIAPHNIDGAYPYGADYFELRSVSNTIPAVVFLYYAPDVDKVDFKTFRTQTYLYQVRMNGTDFKKTQ
jgi:hypothetical protein